MRKKSERGRERSDRKEKKEDGRKEGRKEQRREGIEGKMDERNPLQQHSPSQGSDSGLTQLRSHDRWPPKNAELAKEKFREARRRVPWVQSGGSAFRNDIEVTKYHRPAKLTRVLNEEAAKA